MSNKDKQREEVVEAIQEQVKEKLLADFHASLDRTEAEAREKGAPLKEHHRLDILAGFARGCIEAGAEVMRSASVNYLVYLSVCACAGFAIRPTVEEGDESLHQLFHQLMAMFPSGYLPEGTIIIPSVTNLKDLFGAAEPIAPEDLN